MAPKLSRHAFTRFWDLHAWSGVLGGLVLYVMFLAGAITLFHEQLAVWEEPFAQRTASPTLLQGTLDHALTALGATPQDLWFEPAADGRGTAKLVYRPEGGEWTTAWIDPKRARLVPERERLSGLLYSLHFLWHDAVGEWLYYFAGLLAVALLLALVTGVLIHLKDLARQFHQFRPEKSRRVLWSDMHKVLGVMGLPFQLLYAYTGAFIVLAPLVLRGFVGPVFDGDERRAERLATGHAELPKTKPGAPAAVLDVDALVARARAVRPDVEFHGFELGNYGRDNGVVEAWGEDSGTPADHVMVRLRATDGAVLEGREPERGASGSARRWIQGLHYAHFGGLPLRFLFFALALATCGTILTGNWVWLARRESRRSRAGNRVLARLTIGVGAGTVVAVAALFLASRLVPLDWPDRGSVEELVFVGTLASCVVWALVVRNERALGWRQLGLAGALFAPVPFLAARWSSAGLFGNGPHLASVVAVDLALLVASGTACAAAFALRRAARAPTSAARHSAELSAAESVPLSQLSAPDA